MGETIDHEALQELVEACRIAYQLAEVASDWNLPEVEIDGRMRSIYKVQDIFKRAYRKATGKNP